MKLYRINEYDWWGGNSVEEVLGAYARLTGLSYAEIVDDEDTPVREVTEEEMDRLRYSDDHPDPTNSRSFREEWEMRLAERGEEAAPFFFATTEV
ncbi:hypothetical protein GBA65_15160 [Rubrobacter marinus]|uniref:Uncharacterized protein n=1 Tax=Rubrobacter marinus TaxID=2653852 RepID=A0A6G8PZJ6_9ACTN|nr:hypothetical protein [Rubrobacter marinus]QIN79643.1 hypothetical protein GBA65_15160 [Rubrobacter marinus]